MEGLLQLAANWILPALFFWFVLSFVTKTIVEITLNIVNADSSMLRSAIHHLLGDILESKFYEHPFLVTSTKEPDIKSAENKWWLKFFRFIKMPSRLPSNVSPTLFARIIIDWILQEDVDKVKKTYTDVEYTEARVETLSKNHPHLGSVLLAIVRHARQKTDENKTLIGEMQNSLESWFSAAFESKKKNYRQQYLLTAILTGIMLSVLVNFDVVQMTSQLWHASQLREYAELSQEIGQKIMILPEEYITTPIGWEFTIVEGEDHGPLGFDAPREYVVKFPDRSSRNKWHVISNLPASFDYFGWAIKWLGLFIGGFLVGVGAQYINDLLQKPKSA